MKKEAKKKNYTPPKLKTVKLIRRSDLLQCSLPGECFNGIVN